MTDPDGPWTLQVCGKGAISRWQVSDEDEIIRWHWIYEKLGCSSGRFLLNKLKNDADCVNEGLTIVYTSDLFMKEAGGVITQVPNAVSVLLCFDQKYCLRRHVDIPRMRFFKEFVSRVVLSQHLQTLLLNVPIMTAVDEENAVAAFSRCRLKRLILESHFSNLFWARMVDVSRCHATDIKVSCGPDIDNPLFLTAINQNMEGDFAMWTIDDCLARRVKHARSWGMTPIEICNEDEPYHSVSMGSRAFFSFVGMSTVHIERALACAAKRMQMRMRVVDYADHERTLILRDCVLADGHLPDMRAFGNGLRRLRVIACGLIE